MKEKKQYETPEVEVIKIQEEVKTNEVSADVGSWWP